MPIPPYCERALHIPDAVVATGAYAPGREMMRIPSKCERVPGTSGDAGDPIFVRFYVAGSIVVEVRFFQNGRWLRRAIESLASDHFRLLGPRGLRDPPPVGHAYDFGMEYTFGKTGLGS